MKIAICGIDGRMGVAILKTILDRKHDLCGAFTHKGSPFTGKPAGFLIGSDKVASTIEPISGNAVEKCDVIIDFSAPAATMELLDLAESYQKPLVIGTTAFTDEQKNRIEEASKNIPLILSPNMSLGVNLLFKLTELASKALNSDYDVEVFEAHHRFKKDAPSGTAKRLVEIIHNNFPGLNDAVEYYGREGITGERTTREIGVHAMRGGDIVGEHTVYFAAMGERIELTHRASSRDTLARGAVLAAEFLVTRKPGSYSMFDVLGF